MSGEGEDTLNADDLQRKYLRSEAERMRLKQLNSALRKQLENTVRPGSVELVPLAKGFLPSDERLPHNRPNSESLWKKYVASNLGINKRYRIYIGYLYERMGWSVDYTSGKNLISRKDNRLIVTLSEAIYTVDLNAMYSLLGEAMECGKDNAFGSVSAMCVTSSVLVSRVMTLANKFNVAVREHFYFHNFPCVRCKANFEGQRVYYVPDDDEYLSVRIVPEDGDKYCWTADEAEVLRFYRPY